MRTVPNPETTLPVSAQSERFHALDAVRAFALILGIFFHGVEPFISYISPTDWAIQDGQHSVFLDGFFYVAHLFRMQAFFVIAGYFAHLLYHRRGAIGFLQNRAKRILLPFLLFWPIMYVLLGVLWVWGQQKLALPNSPTALMSPWRVMYEDVVGLKWVKADVPITHLWFLYYLTLLCAAVLLVRPLVARLDANGRLRRGLDRGLTYLLGKWWGGVGMSLLIVAPMSGMKSWFGVDTPNRGLVPQLGPLVLYGVFFAFGWFLHRQAGSLNGFRNYWRQNLLISGLLIAGLTAFFLNLVYSVSTQPKSPAPDPAAVANVLLLYNSVYAIASMTAVFAFIGLILTYFNHPSQHIRYLSDASYWLYIAHLPVVVLFQILVTPLPLHWLLKLPLIFIPTFVILLLTYQYGVRSTWVGVLLNGRRYQRNQKAQ
ncbi:acyltransferase family protein [Spirosoma areae]